MAGADRFQLRQSAAAFSANRPQPIRRELPAGLYGLSNGGLDEPWPKTVRLKSAVDAWLRNPDGTALRAGYSNLRHHLEYVGWLAETRRWLAGDELSLADFAAAGHLSALDLASAADWSMSEPARAPSLSRMCRSSRSRQRAPSSTAAVDRRVAPWLPPMTNSTNLTSLGA